MALGLRYDDVDAVDHPHYARYATVTPGSPGRCPECDEFGYIDHADLVRCIQTQHCRACGFRWEYHFDGGGAIREVRELAGSAPPARTLAERLRAAEPVVDLRSDAPGGAPTEVPARTTDR